MYLLLAASVLVILKAAKQGLEVEYNRSSTRGNSSVIQPWDDFKGVRLDWAGEMFCVRKEGKEEKGDRNCVSRSELKGI